MKRTNTIAAVSGGVTFLVFGLVVLVGKTEIGHKWWVERNHGIKLPASARHIQSKRAGKWLGPFGVGDRGVCSIFEMDDRDLASFLQQLTVKASLDPTTIIDANPLMNGWNVWPRTAHTFVPGNDDFDGMTKTWSGNAAPGKMLSCTSPKGDWLHVEIWSVANHKLVKIYTDWN